ncbi:hypothetical protein O4H53_18715 [Sulfitobacter sp. G21635-S1]|jgi:hypothetical protein|uniref:hypothetical protein n=1 Tax=Sulfitobacter sp. G21635-S1 TaxID=3014043 RepID=UPI0022AF011B|nr:hypothetical protein [Sulfitobacter sp. G21635-S1]MCZ4257587.1 hypothetical protein [Sulfitobacter sp. G21635-S1]
MRLFAILLSLISCLSTAAHAQESDSLFADYEAYAAFVDRHVMRRDFIPLIQRLGGRDEFTPEQLAANQRQLEGAWPRDFVKVSVFKEIDLGGGIRQEGRIYWTGTSYAFFYAMLHQREDDLAVITFLLNSSSKPIMDRF